MFVIVHKTTFILILLLWPENGPWKNSTQLSICTVHMEYILQQLGYNKSVNLTPIILSISIDQFSRPEKVAYCTADHLTPNLQFSVNGWCLHDTNLLNAPCRPFRGQQIQLSGENPVVCFFHRLWIACYCQTAEYCQNGSISINYNGI